MPGLLKLNLDKILFRRLSNGIRWYENFSKTQAEARIKQRFTCKTRDMFATILEAKDPETGDGLPLADIVSEASLLIVAGEMCLFPDDHQLF